MKALHLNLLRASERVSSSPIRLRVMMPVAAILACIGMLVWWGVLWGQAFIVTSNVTSLEDGITRNEKAHADIMQKMADANELESELEQLEYYRSSRNVWGQTLTSLAEVVPLKVQLVKVSIPPPPPQVLTNPKKPKSPPLPGPTNATERVSLLLAGRATKEAPVLSLMESLEGEGFTNALVVAKGPGASEQSPTVHSFGQESAKRGEARMIAFEIEYRAKERRFLK